MPTSPPRKSILILISTPCLGVRCGASTRQTGEIMRFYRPLGRISALTFDLDDTLYDNRPVILRTEREALTFVQIIIRRCAASRMKICNACARRYGKRNPRFITT